MGDLCVRCGREGNDRRTLWMACMYAMNELPRVPFDEKTLFHIDPKDLVLDKPPIGVDLPRVAGLPERRINLTSGTYKCSGAVTPRGFFTLLVCKACRASWMQAIENWFTSQTKEEDYQ